MAELPEMTEHLENDWRLPEEFKKIPSIFLVLVSSDLQSSGDERKDAGKSKEGILERSDF